MTPNRVVWGVSVLAATSCAILTGCAAGVDEDSTKSPDSSAVSVTPTGAPQVRLVAPKGGFADAQPSDGDFPGSGREYTRIAESASGCVLFSHTAAQPAPEQALGESARDLTVAELNDAGREFATPLEPAADTWFATSGETTLAGEPSSVINAVEARWDTDDTSLRLAMRASVVPNYDGSRELHTVGVLLSCPADADAESAWETLRPAVRLDIWTPGPESPGDWPAAEG